MSGLMDLTGEPGPPVKSAVLIADITAGFYCALYVTAAVSSGAKGPIEVPLLDAAISLLTHQAGYYFATGEAPKRTGSAHPQIAPYQAFRAKDGYIILAVGSDHLWRKFCEAIGRPELADDPRFKTNGDRVRNRTELVRIIEEELSRGEVSRWVSLMWRNGGSHIQRGASLPGPLREAEGTRGGDEGPYGAVKAIRALGSSAALYLGNYAPPPALGEHTVEVLRGLGYSDEEIRRLIEDGAARAGKI